MKLCPGIDASTDWGLRLSFADCEGYILLPAGRHGERCVFPPRFKSGALEARTRHPFIKRPTRLVLTPCSGAAL